MATVPFIYASSPEDRYDPTRTTILRNSFARSLDKKLSNLIADIREVILDEGGFEPGAVFDRDRVGEKIDAFIDWLEGKVETGILSQRIAWYEDFIRAAYQWGIHNARLELVLAGYTVASLEPKNGIAVVMGQPAHVERFEMLNARVYRELKGIIENMYQQLARTLFEGLSAGEDKRKLFNRIVAEIGTAKGINVHEAIQVNARSTRLRGDVLARTEIIRAHHIATIQEYRTWGVKGVDVDVEWITAGDENVCPACRALAGKIFTLDEIEGMIPYHPLCRCKALPVIVETGWSVAGSYKEAAKQFRRFGVRLKTPIPSIDQVNIIGDAICNDIYSQFPTAFTRMRNLERIGGIDLIILRTNYVEEAAHQVATYTITEKKRIMRFGQRIFSLAPIKGKGLPRFTGPLDPAYAVRHEFGHAYYYAGLKRPERSAFKKFFQEHRNLFLKKVSIYSATNESEAFAESFAIFTDPRYGMTTEYQLPKTLEKIMSNLVGERIVPGERAAVTKVGKVIAVRPRRTFPIIEGPDVELFPFNKPDQMKWKYSNTIEEAKTNLEQKYNINTVQLIKTPNQLMYLDDADQLWKKVKTFTVTEAVTHLNIIGEGFGQVFSRFPSLLAQIKVIHGGTAERLRQYGMQLDLRESFFVVTPPKGSSVASYEAKGNKITFAFGYGARTDKLVQSSSKMFVSWGDAKAIKYRFATLDAWAIARHETGHWIWDKVLEPSAKASWARFYKRWKSEFRRLGVNTKFGPEEAFCITLHTITSPLYGTRGASTLIPENIYRKIIRMLGGKILPP